MVGRGQMVTSVAKIMKNCGNGVTRQNVRGALLRLKNLHFLTNETTKQGCKITICNYNRYQNMNLLGNQPPNHLVTNDQPTTNHLVTTNNKYNNYNNDNNKKGANKKKKAGRPTWLTPFIDIWTKCYGGDLPVQRSVKALTKVIEIYGTEKAVTGWKRYCESTEARYASAESYASKAGSYINPKPPTPIYEEPVPREHVLL